MTRLCAAGFLVVALMIPASASAAGVYTGKTSQHLPVALYVEQAKRGEVGRNVVYTGLTGKSRAHIREVATVTVRVACEDVGGARWKELVRFRLLGPSHTITSPRAVRTTSSAGASATRRST